MADAALYAYAYLVGTAFAALTGSALEMRAGRAAGMHPPFLTYDHKVRSLITTLAAGSYLLLCELRRAGRERPLSLPLIAAGLLFASAWALATGVVLVELMGQVRTIF